MVLAVRTPVLIADFLLTVFPDTPTYVIYHELILTSKEYMTQVTSVDAYWLAELGSVFYSVKEKNFDERGNRRTADKEFSKKAELETQMAKQREEWVLLVQCRLIGVCC